MNWLNLHSSVLDSPEVVGSDPVERATWLFLLRFCVGQENGGRIEGARNWKDRRWQQLCRVTLKEVEQISELWTWDGDDMLVQFYPVSKEKEVQAKRVAGKATVEKRWPNKKDDEPEAKEPADSSADSSAINSADSSGDTEGERNRNRKGNRKGKEDASPAAPLLIPEELLAVDGFSEAFSEFVKHRKKIKKPMTEFAQSLFLRKLVQRPADSIAFMEMGIMAGWQRMEWEWFDKAKPNAATNSTEEYGW